MSFSHIKIPLPSTHSHTHKHSTSTSSDHAPSPGHLPHAATLPASLDAHTHKHYHNNSSSPPRTSSPLHHLPNVNPATYLSKHQHEYTLQHSFRSAKHEASLSHSTNIPEYQLKHSNTISAEPLSLTDSRAEEKAEELRQKRLSHAKEDQEAWESIVAKRTAAAHRSSIDYNEEEARRQAELLREMSEGSR